MPARLTVQKIQIRNFGFIRQSSVEFPSHGFVLVTGRNETGTGQFESVGSGKTLLGEALSRTLFNVPGRFTRFGHFSTNGEGDTYVRVDATLEGQPLVVEAGYRCRELSRTGEGLRFTVGNQPGVMHGSILDTRAALAQMIRVTPDVASWTTYIDGSRLNFDDLSEAAAVNLLMNVLDQPPWVEYHKAAVKAKDGFKISLGQAEAKKSAACSRLQVAAERLAQAQEQLTKAEKDHDLALEQLANRQAARLAQIAECQANQVDLTAELKNLKLQLKQAEESEADAYQAAELAFQRAISELTSANRIHQLSIKDATAARAKISALEKSYAVEALKWSNAQKMKALERQAQKRQLEADNSSGEQAWIQRSQDLEQQLNNARLTCDTIQQQVDFTQNALDAEINAPSVCPLAGCGKPWPKSNEAKIASLNQKLAERQKFLADKQAALAQIRAELDAHVGNPFQPAPIPVELGEELIAETFPADGKFKTDISTATAEWQALTERAEKYAAQLVQLQKTSADATAAVVSLRLASRVTSISQKVEQAQNQLTECGRRLTNLQHEHELDKVDESVIKEARTTWRLRAEENASCTELVEQAAAELAECNEGVKVTGYWVEAFSPTGIPNMIIAESIRPLNSISKKVSLRLTGGLLDVVYETSRQLANGADKNELIVKAVNQHGAVQVAGSSKGEAGLINLIVAETLAEVGNFTQRVGYRWYDEVATSQDAVVRRSIFNYLREHAERHRTLTLVVDHSTEVASYASAILVARKLPTGTIFEWC